MIRKYLLLSMAAISLLLALFYYLGTLKNNYEASEAFYSQHTQRRVLEMFKKAGSEQEQIINHFLQTGAEPFSSPGFSSDCPHYIFQNQKILYWSDNHFVPDYSWINGIKKYGLLTQNDHIFLVRKTAFFNNRDIFELVSLIPVYKKYARENNYLKSGYNSEIFLADPDLIDNSLSPDSLLNINTPEGHFLFSIRPSLFQKIETARLPIETLNYLTLFLGFLLLYFFSKLPILYRKWGFERVLILYVVLVMVVRAFMLVFKVPFGTTNWLLFDPQNYYADWLNPSMGDLILNTLAYVGLSGLLAYRFHLSRQNRQILGLSPFYKKIVSVLMVFCSLALIHYTFQLLSMYYRNADGIVSLSLGETFSSTKLGGLLFFVLAAFGQFLTQHFFIHLFYRLNKTNKRGGTMLWLYGTLLTLALMAFFIKISWLILLGAAYFYIVYYFEFPSYLYKLKYRTSVYFFLGAFLFTSICVQILFSENLQKGISDKKKFANEFLAHNDELTEGFLSPAMKEISHDPLIQEALKKKILGHEIISSEIKAHYLGLYFDKYDIRVHTFDSIGNQLGIEDTLVGLPEFSSNFMKPQFQTSNPNIFFIPEEGNRDTKHYFATIRVNNNSGMVILDLKERITDKSALYPDLLMSKQFSRHPETRLYSYGIFNHSNSLIFSNGDYSYGGNYVPAMLNKPDLFTRGIKQDDFVHVGVAGSMDRKMIVTSHESTLKNFLSDFSFLYLLLALVIFGVILYYIVSVNAGQLHMNFSTRIQVYLNTAFLLPFMLLLAITIGMIRKTMLDMQKKFYLENTQKMVSSIKIPLQNFMEGKSSEAFFGQEANKLSYHARTDINVFDLNGNLKYSTRPLLYENNFLSKFINPNALALLFSNAGKEILISEKLGKLNYRSAYVIVKNSENNDLGIMQVPFFNSEMSLSSQLKGVFSIILSICLLLFATLLVVSFYAANQLAKPLKMIAQKIKRISLSEQNEPILWNTNDEIGVLTNSYNDMLFKLEESKAALSQSEKQTAWREMARQVAHEIKNPLTPMKLSIQQLQRTLPSLEGKTRIRIERALNALTEQIDNISEIANSFSEFAKMPVPRIEIFDLVEVTQKTAYLYAQNKMVDLKMDMPVHKLMVRSDRQMMNRVLNNLILNGIQSVPENRQPKIEIRLYRDSRERSAVIEISDNGTGIAEAHRHKVFIPNFSTKVGGTGLGLAMAKRGVEHSGGNIWYETEEGKGTTFYVDLPLAL